MLLTPDLQLIHGILQAGPVAYFRARRTGIRSSMLHDEAPSIFDLMERMAGTGRLPSLTEIHTVTGHQIDQICSDPLDVDLISAKIIRRALAGQLHAEFAELAREDAINENPLAVRDRLNDLVHRTNWSHGEPYSTNTRSSIEEVQAAYQRASISTGILGLSSPWPTMDEASLGLQEGELTVLFAKRKTGKCLPDKTLCHDPVTGRERTIAELVRGGKWRVWTWQENRPITASRPTNYMNCGEKDCLKITWRSGREMIAAL